MKHALLALVLLATACQPKHNPEAARTERLQRQADSLRLLASWQQAQLTEYDSAQARTRRELQTFQTRNEEISRTPASTWPAERVTRYLSTYGKTR
ncbi:hypothetical protein [Hymenobacter pini]|uniref:hypothetical protein n=1 Tax=Hymenobacter pini TaxID=2880879 RepID=UPI001CF5BC53|nr:hypothetical protein [Hymenobacter pini]MCA8829444.1 hypothetical protein [Hymenobacter pini]